MTISDILFYLIGAFILGMALLSVTAKKIFRSAIWLLFCLIGIAALYFWMELEFIAAVQVIVYVGGIVILIIFSIFLTQHADKEMPAPGSGRKTAALLAVLCGAALAGMMIYRQPFQVAATVFDNEVARIGSYMLNVGPDGFALPFEVISMLLLAAMIGCIVIAMREPEAENPSETSNT